MRVATRLSVARCPLAPHDMPLRQTQLPSQIDSCLENHSARVVRVGARYEPVAASLLVDSSHTRQAQRGSRPTSTGGLRGVAAAAPRDARERRSEAEGASI